MSYGFRVYSVELGEAMRYKPLDSWTVKDQHYSDYIYPLVHALAVAQDLLPAKQSWRDIQSMPSIAPAVTVSPGDRFVRWISAGKIGRRLSLELKYGTVGDFSDAMGIHGDTPIMDKAPSRPYRAELLLPEEHGTGLLAVETIGRTAPAPAVALWLGAVSCVAEKTSIWWRPRIEQVTDTEYLTDLIANSKNAEVTLKHVTTDEMGDSRRTQYRLQAPLTDDQRLGAISWIRERMGHGSHADLKGMLRIVGVEHTGDLSFTDGHIQVDDGEATTRIGLSDVQEIFTYPLGKDRPDSDTWNAAVKNRFQQLNPGLPWD